MTVTERHHLALQKLATAYLREIVAGDGISLRDVSEAGITIESDADMPDSVLSNTLNRMSSWWGYSHGECNIEIIPLEAGFFDAGKRAKITFA